MQGAGEAPINTGGRVKDRVTSQFASPVSGAKCPPMLIYKAMSVMFPADGSMPRAGTVARELRDRVYSSMSYPEGFIMDCNPTS